MKKGEAPQLDCAWWKKCKPVTLKNGDLEAALAAYEHAMDAWDKKQSDENHIARIRSLEAVNGAARSVIKACNRMLHNDTITCLEKFPKLISDKKEALGEQYHPIENDAGQGIQQNPDENDGQGRGRRRDILWSI